ncbi:hypothetical protein ACN4EK_31025 [Pantanalinema rosaneae CENA516]|uniref:hypothetical protein n=1 Tax=Pantanalinema rosaneae TaxID=1620701 RepID=UPI003D6EC9ED
MLFGYPLAATAENWLHECLDQILQFIHKNLDNGNLSTDWAEAIAEPYRTRLKRRLKVSEKPDPKKLSLGDKLKSYQTSLKSFDISERSRILQAFNDQNNIALLLSGACACEAITDLPKEIREPVKILFQAAFASLTDLEIRKKQYELIYNNLSYRVCPFCGCEDFDGLDAPQEALDHYLPEHKYPFAAANLRNLVPMGNKCNSRYKLVQDIISKEDGTRRKSFDPYNHHRTIAISLDKSQPFSGAIGQIGTPLPRWEIDFSFDSEEVRTWDEVFKIRERYERDVLNEGFNSYLREFGNHCKAFNCIPTSVNELIDAISRYADFQESNGFKDKAFLKAAVFRMLQIHCQNGDQRLINFIKDIVNGVSV